ncbi:hypothetical protein N7540_000295 [Penicillium herquei]|nr:hypothetical protein N7540_000295 [Penicillium herquei]
MDESTRSFLTQAVRDALTSSGIDHDEGYIDSLISQVDNDVLQAHLATAGGNVEESRLRTSSLVLQTPPASPHKGLGSYRLLQARKKNYANQAGAVKRKKRKQKTAKPSAESGIQSTTFQEADKNSAQAGSQIQISYGVNQEVSHRHLEAYSTNCLKAYSLPFLQLQSSDNAVTDSQVSLPVSTFSSYQSGSAYVTKAMASILIECVKVNSAIAPYGHQTNLSPTRTDSSKIRKYVDEIAEYDYEKAVRTIQKETALAMGRGVQNRYNETIFWKIILKGAALVDQSTLPPARGPADGFTMAEKAATKKFMEAAGYGLGAENQRQCRIFWKNLFQMREAGIDKVLYYRTKEFDSYCRGYPKTAEISLVDAIMSWETQYRPFIEQLETRVLRLGQGDLARLCDLEIPQVLERLEVPKSSWNNAGNEWAFTEEKERFKDKCLHALPTEILLESQNSQFLVSEFGRDKSPFVFLVPQDSMALSVCSIVPVCEGDFLGIFAGSIRFSEEFNVKRGICSPIDNLWLDYSQVTGALNQMTVSESGAPANVRLHWEVVHDELGTDHCTSWRVSARATKPILPFDPLIRKAPRQEQFTLHLSLEYAKRGFLERCKDD